MLIAIDVDSTLYDANTLFSHVAKEHFDLDLPIDTPNWHDYHDYATVSTLLKIFRKAHSADYVKDQIPYPFAVEVCQTIQDRGHVIKFVSDRHPQAASALKKWLAEHEFVTGGLIANDTYAVVGKDKRQWLAQNKPPIVIDDRVRTMLFARYEIGATVFSIQQSWNVNLAGEIDGIFVLKNWQEIGKKVEEYI